MIKTIKYNDFPFIEQGLKFLDLIARTSPMEGRLVGGCVRDFYRGIQNSDLDIAIDHPPQQVMDWAKKQHLPIFPIGLSHGTIIIRFDTVPELTGHSLPPYHLMQITSLRRDIETDGRHAIVHFGTSWKEDAKRRDFTINSLYLDRDSRLYDPFNGRDDLNRGILLFIGDPAQRIEEDFLRVMRFFRFIAVLDINLDAPSVQAGLGVCCSYKTSLNQLSKERVRAEFLKLLDGAHWYGTVKLLQNCAVDEVIFGQPLNHLQDDISISNLFWDSPPLPFTKLAALTLGLLSAKDVKNTLNLSRYQEESIATLHNTWADFIANRHDLRSILVHTSHDFVKQFIAFSSYINPGITKHLLEDLIDLSHLQIPKFPLKAKNLMDKGVKPGPLLGSVIKQTYRWWIERNCLPNRITCLSHALSLFHADNER